jgi:hypothetical protein
MTFPLFEVPAGAVDGSNRIFYVSVDYKPGTPRVWLNGLLLVKYGEDGWTEMGGRKLQLHEAPRLGDTVQVFYTPIS